MEDALLSAVDCAKEETGTRLTHLLIPFFDDPMRNKGVMVMANLLVCCQLQEKIL